MRLTERTSSQIRNEVRKGKGSHVGKLRNRERNQVKTLPFIHPPSHGLSTYRSHAAANIAPCTASLVPPLGCFGRTG